MPNNSLVIAAFGRVQPRSAATLNIDAAISNLITDIPLMSDETLKLMSRNSPTPVVRLASRAELLLREEPFQWRAQSSVSNAATGSEVDITQSYEDGHDSVQGDFVPFGEGNMSLPKGLRRKQFRSMAKLDDGSVDW